MSGGVDSSTSAWLLKRDGHQVVGVTLLFHDSPHNAEKVAQAARVAEKLGIEHHVVDARERFEHEVERAFAQDAQAGIISNPCVRCSAELKMPLLFEQAGAFGCERVATGHYAAVTSDAYGVDLLDYQLRAPLDRSKDQTFLLYRLNQEQLSRLVFPLNATTKGVVRRMAMQAGLQRLSPLHDGQGIPCFFDDGDAEQWLEGAGGVEGRPGPIVDLASHERRGSHEGLFRYMPGDVLEDGSCVAAKDLEGNVLYVGPKQFSTVELVVLEDMHWTSVTPPKKMRSCRARIAYDARPVPAHVLCTGGGVVVTFTKPVCGVCAGMPVVLYSDDLVLGGGVVAR